MATTQSQPQTSIEVKRTFAAPRDRVYRAWTDAKQFALWFHPTADYDTVITRMDLRVGGKYHLEIHHKGGNIHKVSGEYRQVKPPEKLAFTWQWQSQGQESISPETLVTVEFREVGASTEVTILHENLFNAEDREKHNQGWVGCLGQLENYLA
jgi:uncharacterized protein YndB with AHSA1/START domain